MRSSTTLFVFASSVAACSVLTDLSALAPIQPITDGGTDAMTDAGGDATPQAPYALSAPVAVLVKPNASVSFVVNATKSNGFDADIGLSFAGLPAGVTAKPATIAKGTTSAMVTLTADGTAKPESITSASIIGVSAPHSANTNVEVDVAGQPGTLDHSFGKGTGVVSLSDTVGMGFLIDPTKIVITADGGIVITAGVTGPGNTSSAALLRLKPTGELDTAFGTNGETSQLVDAFPTELLLQADGKLILGGYSNLKGVDVGVAARWDATGHTDAAYGMNGVATYTDGTTNYRGTCFALQSDGRLVMGGWSSDGTEAFVTRLTTTGAIDATYGAGPMHNRMWLGPTMFDAYPYSAAMQSQDQLVLVGFVSPNNTRMLGAMHFDNTGTAIPFGNGTGGVSLNVQTSGAGLFDVALTKTGDLYATGDSKAGPSTVVHLTSSGFRDSLFGTNGVVSVPVTSNDMGTGIAIQQDNALIVSGTGNGFKSSFLYRLTPGGQLDASFGSMGIVKPAFGVGAEPSSAWDVALQPDGRIVVAGIGASSKLYVARYWP